MKLQIKHIAGIQSAMRANDTSVTVECTMTEQQMFDALCVFCEHITDATFAKWVSDLTPEVNHVD